MTIPITKFLGQVFSDLMYNHVCTGNSVVTENNYFVALNLKMTIIYLPSKLFAAIS